MNQFEQTPTAIMPSQGEMIQTRKSGRWVRVRHLCRDDAPLLVEMFMRLSARTRWLRFATPRGDEVLAWREANRLVQRDGHSDTMLLGTVWEDGIERAVALVQVMRLDAIRAEIAAVVRDDYQNEGLGGILCRRATQIAMERGVRILHLVTQAENRIVQRLIRSAGMPFTTEMRYGEIAMTIQLPELA
jgi:GNAT superfamily N-acetyltransferase